MFRLLFDGKSSESGVSSFQALSMSLAGRVGTGNIAGVATAIAFGGPDILDVDGCFFWSKYRFVETTLAQIYKEKHLGEFRGGPAFLYRERIRREMVCCFICRGFYHFGRCVLPGFKRTLLQMEYRMPLK
jgi:Na+/alanine symporter